jgi:hypothetical protein
MPDLMKIASNLPTTCPFIIKKKKKKKNFIFKNKKKIIVFGGWLAATPNHQFFLGQILATHFHSSLL